MSDLRTCGICKKSFRVKRWLVKNGWGIYCSMRCKNEGQKNGEMVLCATCGAGVYRTPKEIRHRSVTNRSFCNKSCLAVWKNKNMFIGRNHNRWKHGGCSYRATFMRRVGNPRCTSCSFQDIRALVVHHIDRNRKNNSLYNLKWLCHNCHFLEHDGKTI